MNSSRRWLIIFAIVISILVTMTVFLVLLTKGNEVTLLSENTPQGTVQRYLIAVQEENYQEAYGYLSIDESQRITTYDRISTAVIEVAGAVIAVIDKVIESNTA